jgi:hypothetical protein
MGTQSGGRLPGIGRGASVSLTKAGDRKAILMVDEIPVAEGYGSIPNTFAEG